MSEREQKLIEALQNFMGIYDTPVERRRRVDDSIYQETIATAREILAECDQNKIPTFTE